jgi:hypothetical protein
VNPQSVLNFAVPSRPQGRSKVWRCRLSTLSHQRPDPDLGKRNMRKKVHGLASVAIVRTGSERAVQIGQGPKARLKFVGAVLPGTWALLATQAASSKSPRHRSG